MSFLAYLLRHFTAHTQMGQYQNVLATALVSLLKTCPDSVVIRKELLVAIRHVLATAQLRGCPCIAPFLYCIPPF
jgi:transformation/transcription domain-associated protein